jgi:hypothetical protein
MSVNLSIPLFVIPAKAGVHHRRYKFRRQVMDSRLRGGDETLEGEGAL